MDVAVAHRLDRLAGPLRPALVAGPVGEADVADERPGRERLAEVLERPAAVADREDHQPGATLLPRGFLYGVEMVVAPVAGADALGTALGGPVTRAQRLDGAGWRAIAGRVAAFHRAGWFPASASARRRPPRGVDSLMTRSRGGTGERDSGQQRRVRSSVALGNQAPSRAARPRGSRRARPTGKYATMAAPVSCPLPPRSPHAVPCSSACRSARASGGRRGGLPRWT